jgi:pyruvate,water dikinase
VPPVLALDAVDRTALPVAGGKGANLGELIRAGFPVPSGFVVTTAAYKLLLNDLDLAQRIPVLLGADPGGASVRHAIETAPMPAGLAEALRRAYRELGAGPVAVRSSATAEDLPEAAFAGQQETYLNVVGEDAVLDAVRRRGRGSVVADLARVTVWRSFGRPATAR